MNWVQIRFIRVVTCTPLNLAVKITLTGTIVASDFILSSGSQSNPTPQLQTVSEVLPQLGQIAFSSDRTLTLSNTTAAMNATIINVITTNSNLVGDNVTVVTTGDNVIADNVNSVTVTVPRRTVIWLETT